MNKSFKVVFCILSIIISQTTFPNLTLEYRRETWRIQQHLIKEATPQISSDGTIIVNNHNDNDHITMVLSENKLKIYYFCPEITELQEMQDSFNEIDFSDIDQNAPYFFSNTNDPIFHAPIADLDEIYYSNPEHCFINTEKAITIEDSLIECSHIELKSRKINLESFLIDTQTIELKSNNPLSLLSSIKFTIKNKSDFKWQPCIGGVADFNDNFVVFACLSASKIELECLPGSFYLNENTICFK